MVQKSGEKTTWDGAKTLEIDGRNYQPQLVNAGFLPSTEWKIRLLLIEVAG